MIFILFGNLARSIAPTLSAFFETFLIVMMLFLTILYLSESKVTFSNNELIYYSFVLYLILHFIFASTARPIILDSSFYDLLLYNLMEFRLSTLGYFLPFVFIPIFYKKIDNFEKFVILLLKISIFYSLFEQVLSSVGFRSFFEYLYYKSGVVTENQIELKSLGMYRIWGLIGSPQVLGIFHVIGLIYLLDHKEKFWSLLCILAIIVSTSKSAMLILIIYGFIYLLQKRYYLTFIFFIATIVAISIIMATLYAYIQDMNIQDDYPRFGQFVGSIYGYFILLTSVAEESARGSAGGQFIKGGALNEYYIYFLNNPMQLLAGKGITYSIFQVYPPLLVDYNYLSSDYYFLTFIDQYGLIGLLYILYIFVFYPFIKLLSSDKLYYAVPIIFFLAMLHYPPNISKLFMIFMSYSLYKIYLKEKYTDEI